jgi:hypothetical protein
MGPARIGGFWLLRLAHTDGWKRPHTEMTGDYIELANIDEALRYIQTVLVQGKALGLLASTALKVVGGVYAFAPLRPKELTLPPLTQGGVPESADSYAVLASEIEQHLSASASKIVIFEDALASAGDPCLEGPAASGLRVATYGSEIYYLLLAEDAGTKRLAETVAIALSDSAIRTMRSVFLANWQARIWSIPSHYRFEDINAVVRGTPSMVVGAFDGESFLRFRVRRGHGNSPLAGIFPARRIEALIAEGLVGQASWPVFFAGQWKDRQEPYPEAAFRPAVNRSSPATWMDSQDLGFSVILKPSQADATRACGSGRRMPLAGTAGTQVRVVRPRRRH